MLPTKYKLAFVAIVVLSSYQLADAVGPHMATQCSPLGVPCVPSRVTYGYVPTSWRRWPTDHLAVNMVAGPETVPTPAEEPLPTVEAEPAEPFESLPEPRVPPNTPESQMVPPFGNEPLKPPTGEAPFAPQFDDSPLPPPFEDTPPQMPEDSGPAAKPETQPTPSPGTTSPATRAPAAAPDTSLPTMPDDDPFKDDPEMEMRPTSPDLDALGPSNVPVETNMLPAPEGATTPEPDPLEPFSPGAAPPKTDSGETDFESRTMNSPARLSAASMPPAPPASSPREPRRLDAEVDRSGLELPDGAPLGNPLRPARQTSREATIVPTANFSAQAASRASWRSNPLRSK